jgi:RimJ/RimL family protein N-acetyltransferase
MLTLRRLSTSENDIARLQRVLELAPRYAHIVTGEPVSPSAAEQLVAALPPGGKYDDKFVFEALQNGSSVGCADLIRGYPTESFAFIGLLLIAEPLENQGYGTEVFRKLCEVASSWQGCNRLRLGVLESNERAMRFWARLGFVATGDVKPFHAGRVQTRSFAYERPLYAAA